MAAHWEDAERQPSIPTPEQWPTLKERLGLGDDFDDLINSDRRWAVPTTTHTNHRSNGPKAAAGGYGPALGARADAVRQALGWTTCGHDTWRPGVVLDPFAGSGTTLAVAAGMARHAIGIDIDIRNAALALDRVGPLLLHIDWPTANFNLLA